MFDANVVKFSNDGRLMLLTTTDGHILVLDSFCGTLLSTYNVKLVSSNATLEASFSPDGMFVMSENMRRSVHPWLKNFVTLLIGSLIDNTCFKERAKARKSYSQNDIDEVCIEVADYIQSLV